MMVGVALAVMLGAAPSPAAIAVLAKHECNRCHEVEGLAVLPTEGSCASCHRDISLAPLDPARFARGEKKFGAAWPRFVTRTALHYNHLPALKTMDRFKASWLKQFLTSPHDVRPGLTESMFRPAFTPAELDALVAGWNAQPDQPAAAIAPAAIERGRKLFEQKQCATCHLLGANHPPPPVNTRLQMLAPDLQHVAARLNRATLVAWLRDPSSVVPGTQMPDLKLTAEEADALADFLLGARAKVAASSSKRAPKTVKGPVPSYEEVEAKVFRAICWHCHSNPDFANGNGGPGMSGGFGFAPIKLSFATYDELLAGSVDARGKRRSVFRPGASGEPVLIEVLRQRYVENARDLAPPGANGATIPLAPDVARGMPLGLPALTDEQFSLVLRWVKGGHPGPTGEASEDEPPSPMLR